ncbi:MAG TPA: tRNA (N6-threonylcarbamoyladenosine(37)-N6)-methyltransferase TrmO [Victivallales bacterium]|nr:tRNA (N6-threonylcarbamoyladenosine(37)-N6)-methyltransferase TrmO [Victivallales bacterium]
MFEIKPIGIINTSYEKLMNMPIQPNGASNVTSHIEINEEYIEGLTDLIGFSHIILIYMLHKANVEKLKVVPFMDTVERGIFATRSPQRPNHIGLSAVKLIGIDGNKITVNGADVLNGTPLIDIKPYIKNVDSIPDAASGWINLNRTQIGDKRSDDRFV